VAKIASQQKSAELGTSWEICKSPEMDRESKGISCIWCYLIKEGVKKAHSGIRRLKTAGAKQE